MKNPITQYLTHDPDTQIMGFSTIIPYQSLSPIIITQETKFYGKKEIWRVNYLLPVLEGVENCRELVLVCPLALTNKNYRIMTFLRYIFDLSHDCPTTAASPSGNYPALAACMETESSNESFKSPFLNKPSTHDIQKIHVHAKISFGSSTQPNSIL